MWLEAFSIHQANTLHGWREGVGGSGRSWSWHPCSRVISLSPPPLLTNANPSLWQSVSSASKFRCHCISLVLPRRLMTLEPHSPCLPGLFTDALTKKDYANSNTWLQRGFRRLTFALHLFPLSFFPPWQCRVITEVFYIYYNNNHSPPFDGGELCWLVVDASGLMVFQPRLTLGT